MMSMQGIMMEFLELILIFEIFGFTRQMSVDINCLF